MAKRKHIMHLDGDSFFVSVEMAKDPSLRGRAVVSGQERGIASAMSYEAKKLGVTRGMPVFQIRKLFPQVAIVSSDYESYAIFSRRMFDIVKRYTDDIEEYSIDECFADFTAVEAYHKEPLSFLERIKSDIKRELGITVSLGVGPTKVIAKTASKRNKPDGLTILSPADVPEALSKIPVDNVWGIGAATAIALRKKGVSTALEFAQKPLPWVREHFSKPMEEMWYELNSVAVLEVRRERAPQKSIMKTRTFGPASGDRGYVFSQLSKNVENACKKARDMGLRAREFSIYLKTSDFTYSRECSRLTIPSSDPFTLLREAGRLYALIYRAGALYRATGVTLYGLVSESAVQEDLFGQRAIAAETGKLVQALDRVNRKYGKSLIHMASSGRAIAREERGEIPPPFMPRGIWKRLSVPYLGEAR